MQQDPVQVSAPFRRGCLFGHLYYRFIKSTIEFNLIHAFEILYVQELVLFTSATLRQFQERRFGDVLVHVTFFTVNTNMVGNPEPASQVKILKGTALE